ncbi:DUF2637 domain-containing protein [Streptomyces sp. 2RAF24]|uniref:DUF2637 domain-containing protein n=1 Tax=Streptomyces sp. 2RAF24 TaxID=3232997 RepID=UPI003F9C343C
MHRPELTPTQRKLITGVAFGAVLIAAIGFVGSYTAVSKRAHAQGLGWFADVFPLGVDLGIVVLLALDMLLAWLRMPLPLLRHTAWLLTGATIVFNGAAAWPDPLGVSMHAVIPLLFVVTVEAARHAVGRIAEITADRHIESVRLVRWLLSPTRTFVLWRRMKLWEMRSYAEVIRFEQDRLVYRAQLQARYGRAWRRKAPIEALLPLRLMRYGRPLGDAPAAQPTEPSAEFDRAAAEAVALAPGAPGSASASDPLVLDLAPMHPPIPELTAGAPAPAPALATARPRVQVHARLPHPNPTPDHTSGAHPHPEPDDIDPEFADLVRRGRELSESGRLTQKRAKRELRIGQDKAQLVIAAVYGYR